CYFFKDRWFNIISMVRSNGIHYYCNIASPFVWDGEAIKYIDYDLDLKVFPNDLMKVLDENEYALHYQEMNYNEQLDKILRQELESLKTWILEDERIYTRKNVYKYLQTFKNINKKDTKF
ncbi:MAG: DUF402 domain-containing protein, partial [Erysipelotrichales bacterium]